MNFRELGGGGGGVSFSFSSFLSLDNSDIILDYSINKVPISVACDIACWTMVQFELDIINAQGYGTNLVSMILWLNRVGHHRLVVRIYPRPQAIDCEGCEFVRNSSEHLGSEV